jgi:hypothetical protein
MRKPKRARETTQMIQTAVWLQRDVHERLKRAGGERGLGDEIRRRLQLTVDAEQQWRDPITELLVDLTRKIAFGLADGTNRWGENRWAAEQLKEGVGSLILKLCMSSQESSQPPPTLLEKLRAKYGPDVKTEDIGRFLAEAALVENAIEALRVHSGANKWE